MLINKLLNSPPTIFVLNILLALLIFIADINFPAITAINTLYVATIMLTLWLSTIKHIICFAILCIFLTIIGACWSLNTTWSSEHLINLAITIFAILLTTTFAIHRKTIMLALEKNKEKLIWLSTHDELTGIFNRRYFNQQITLEWNRLMRTQTSLALIILDLDCFKQYNDTLGHQAGDNCLKMIANAINQAINRSSDFAARYGGEEFVLLMPNTSITGMTHIAQKIQSAITALNIEYPCSSGTTGLMTVSMGLSTMIPIPACTEDVLIKQADHALYQAKNSGKNCYIMYNDNNQLTHKIK